MAVDGLECGAKTLKLSYGMTKYCNSFLWAQKCLNTECLYQHFRADKKYICKKQDNQSIKKYINIDIDKLEEKFVRKS